jgi:hypothetical protein
MYTLDFPKVVDPGVKKHFVDAYKSQTSFPIEVIYTIDDQTSQTDVLQNYTGTGVLSKVNEGQEYDEDAPIQAYGTSLTAVKYGKLIKVTKEMQMWAKTKDIFDAAKMHGEAAARTVQIHAALPLVKGWDSTVTSMTDGKSLFAADHPRADGGASQSNTSTLHMSDTNFEVMLLGQEALLDDRGNLITSFIDTIVVPPALRKTAKTILGSTLKSGTTDNDMNVYKSDGDYSGIKLYSWDYLSAANGGSDTAYFGFDSSLTGLIWQWAEKANVTRDTSIGFKSDNVYYKVDEIFANGWRDWRKVRASTGVA